MGYVMPASLFNLKLMVKIGYKKGLQLIRSALFTGAIAA